MDNFQALQRLYTLLKPRQWIFAKTMPQNPHEYTLRKHWEHEDEFCEAVELIRKFGYHAKFKGRSYIQFNVLDKFYWTMGAPIEETILINRASTNKNNDHPYDRIACSYDEWFSTEESLEENKYIAEQINKLCAGSILDVGCGTGSISKMLSCSRYLGIDPSSSMLSRFAVNCPDKKYLKSRYEDFPVIGFDAVISLFGSISYVAPDKMHRLNKQLNQGGKYFLMFLKPGYYPVTHYMAGIEIPYYKFSDYTLPTSNVNVTEWKNYMIVEGDGEW